MLRRSVLWLALAAVASPAAAEPRLALVIGNSTYAGLPPVPACAASVSVVSAALKRAGFDVTERLNVSNGRMGAAITEFGDAIARTPDAVAVAYACGYAVGYDGRVFLLPASATIERETDVLTQGVVARLLVGTVVASDARAGLVLLDSVARPGSTAPIALESLIGSAATAGRGIVVVHSTAALPDGPTPLAAGLVASMAAPDVELHALLADMRAAMQGVPRTTVAVRDTNEPVWLLGGPHAPPARPAEPAPARPISPAPAPAVNASPRNPGIAALNEADRRRVQLALQRLGYYNGRVDGAGGPDTLAAIRRFQHELGAEMTGRLTNEQAGRLLADGR